MNYLILFDPDGTATMRLILEHGISPSNVYVWDNLSTHQSFLQKLAKVYKFNVIKQDLFTEDIGMKFDEILSNPPYDDGMYVKTMKLLPNLLKEDGKFQFLVPNKILIPYTKGATFAKKRRVSFSDDSESD